MTYEIAKKLKEAGFPEDINNPDGYYYGKDYSDEDGTYVPSLSELIEACGDVELEFWIRNDHARVSTGSFSDEDGTPIWLEGVTPEDAVAELWLALNKK